MKKTLLIVGCIFSILFQTSGQDSTRLKMSDFIGVNTNVASYDKKFIDDLAHCTKWIREYHSWGQYEVADNYYRWDNITKYPYDYTWPDHNKFMDECKRLGINVLIDVLHKPAWAGENRGAYSNGDGSKPDDYLDKLEFMGQLVARYGAQKIDDSKLETTDKVSGLNYIKYYEDDNEPDYWWWTPRWPANKYAIYCNAVHDGYGVEPGENYPLLGIKSVDSTAVHVLGGLTGDGISYLQQILDNSYGRIPFDVINVHTYCTDDKQGYSPENELKGIEKKLNKFFQWRDLNTPDIPLWITEFGWDTYSIENSHSFIYAPPQQQANYILRSFFICLKMGFEKAFLFMGSDPNSTSIQQFSSSGLLYDKNNGLAKKPSYYYLACMQKTLGDARLTKIVSYRKAVNNNEVYCFEFLNDQSEKIYAIWTREKYSETDNNTRLSYSLDLSYSPEAAYIIKPKDKLLAGEKIALTPSGNTLELELSETPQFVVLKENTSHANTMDVGEIGFSIFPNPINDSFQIIFENPFTQNIEIKLFGHDGKWINTIADGNFEQGQHKLYFENKLPPGVYLICASTRNLKQTKKIIIK